MYSSQELQNISFAQPGLDNNIYALSCKRDQLLLKHSAKLLAQVFDLDYQEVLFALMTAKKDLVDQTEKDMERYRHLAVVGSKVRERMESKGLKVSAPVIDMDLLDEEGEEGVDKDEDTAQMFIPKQSKVVVAACPRMSLLPGGINVNQPRMAEGQEQPQPQSQPQQAPQPIEEKKEVTTVFVSSVPRQEVIRQSNRNSSQRIDIETRDPATFIRALCKSSRVKDIVLYGTMWNQQKRRIMDPFFTLSDIPPYVINSHLTSLSIVNAGISDLSAFESILRDNTTLITLNLSNNTFTSINPIAYGLRNNSTLKELILDASPVTQLWELRTEFARDFYRQRRRIHHQLAQSNNDRNTMKNFIKGREIPKYDDRYLVSSIQPLAEALQTNTTLEVVSLLGHDIRDISSMENCLKTNTTLKELLVCAQDRDLAGFCQGLKENKGLKLAVVGLMNEERKYRRDVGRLYEVMLENKDIVISTQPGCVPSDMLTAVRRIHPDIHLWNFDSSYSYCMQYEYETRLNYTGVNTKRLPLIDQIYSTEQELKPLRITNNQRFVSISARTMTEIEELSRMIEKEEERMSE